MESKLVIVSWGFAPQVAGSPILLDNLLREYKGGLEAIVGWDLSARVDESFLPACKTHIFRMPNIFLEKVFRKFQYQLSFLVDNFVLKQLKKLKPSAVMAVFPNGIYAVAAYKACQKLNIPYFIHMHDLWEENASRAALEHANIWEREILLNADHVFCMTTTQQQHYHEKYDISTTLLPHTTSKELLQRSKAISDVKKANPEKEKHILYTGNVSELMNLDALHQFVKAVELMPEDYQVTILINLNEEQLKSLGIFHPRIHYDWVSREQAQTLQRNADVLFLPLSHKNGSYHEVKTVYATKTLEYLLSETPMLVFSPPYSFHSQDAKAKGWGHVVEEDSSEAIVEGIKNLLNDPDLQSKLVSKAIQEVYDRDASKYAELLLQKVNNSTLSQSKIQKTTA